MSGENWTKGEWKATGPSISCKGSGYIGKALEVFMSKKERLANATLMASSQDLYYELKDRLEQARCGCSNPACKRCLNDKETELVLAKARGEQ